MLDPHNEKMGLAYIYFNFRNKREHTLINLQGSILRQLVHRKAKLPNAIINAYVRHSQLRTNPAAEDIIDLLHRQLENNDINYLIVDAIDECPEEEGTQYLFLNMIQALQDAVPLNILLTSRFVPLIQQRFSAVPTLQISADPLDVKAYLEANLYRLASCVQRDMALRQLIVDQICNVVNGMFLLARLHLVSLIGRASPKAIKLALRRLPQGSDALESAYSEVFKRIDAQEPGLRTLADQVLTLVACAQRPLTVDEFRHAFAVELGESALDEDNFADVEDLVSTCAGLVMIDHESGVVRFVHDTTREFFERLRPTKFQNGPRILAELCLTYLSFTAFLETCETDDTFERRLRDFALFPYAAEFWGLHAHPSPVQTTLRSLVLSFLACNPKVQSAAQALFIPAYKYPGYSQDGPRNTHGIHLAAYFGLDHLVSHLLQHPDAEANPNLTDSDLRTPLILASARGHTPVVSLLLSTPGVLINHPDTRGHTALIHAARGGHVSVVSLLMSSPAIKTDHPDTEGRTPLSHAASEGHDRVVELLLTSPDVIANREDDEGRTPVWRAAKAGHARVTKILLSRDDVSADSGGVESGSAMLWAAGKGHDEVVSQLLDRQDLTINLRDWWGKDALTWAAGQGHLGIVKQILGRRKDAERDGPDKSGRTALSYAAGQGKEAVLRVLLSEGAEPCSVDEDGRTPLSHAAGQGFEGVARVLLEHSVKHANLADRTGRTPLSYASDAVRESKGLVELLLAHGASPLARDKAGRDCVWFARKKGYAVIEAVLLERIEAAEDLAQQRELENKNGQTDAEMARVEQVAELLKGVDVKDMPGLERVDSALEGEAESFLEDNMKGVIERNEKGLDNVAEQLEGIEEPPPLYAS